MMMVATVFVASFLGSFHCVGMCGGFVTLYSTRASGRVFQHFAYNLGRLFTYSFLGCMAGAIGESLMRTTTLLGIQWLVSVGFGLLLVLAGLRTLFPANRLLARARFRGPSTLLALITQLQRSHASRLGPFQRTFSLGALSTLLPCGWLYTFLVVAAAAGSISGALLLMFVFWLGTLPAMLLTGVISQSVGTAVGRYAPKATAVLVLLVGLLTVFRHDASLIGESESTNCHHSEEAELRPDSIARSFR